MDGLGLGRRGGFARADRPHRFVGDDRAGECLGAGLLEDRGELGLDPVFGLARFALVQRLAHAQHRHQSGVLGCEELAGDHGVVLGVMLAALGMPDQAVAGADIDQHRGRHLAGVGALFVGAHVLGAELQATALEGLDQFADVGQRRHHYDIDAGRRQSCGDGGHQFGGEGPGAVQLPVSGDDLATHEMLQNDIDQYGWAQDSRWRTPTAAAGMLGGCAAFEHTIPTP